MILVECKFDKGFTRYVEIPNKVKEAYIFGCFFPPINPSATCSATTFVYTVFITNIVD